MADRAKHTAQTASEKEAILQWKGTHEHESMTTETT